MLVCRLADIPEDDEAPGTGGKQGRHLIFVEDMPVEAIPSRVPRLNVRDSRRLHIARERNPGAISAIIKRVIRGIVVRRDRSRIVDAWVEGSNLVVLSASFQRLYIPAAELARYLGSRIASMNAFEIDEDGSYLYWPHADVHLGWEQLQGIVDPTTLVVAQRKSAAFNVRYGATIRGLREAHGLTQFDIKGITDRHLRRIEHGQIAATNSVLEALANAHKMSLADYLAELAKRL
ncbi:MAG: helix-turn-helix domain-containing protein [Thermoguttaceae bacterium]